MILNNLWVKSNKITTVPGADCL